MKDDERIDSVALTNWSSNPERLRLFEGECALGFPLNEGLEETAAKLCGYCDWRF